MKYVGFLLDEEKDELRQIKKCHKSDRVRKRAEAILLSNGGYSINSIADRVAQHRNTISCLITAFRENGFDALYDKARSGRPPIFNQDEQTLIVQKTDDNPKNLRQVTAEINQHTNKHACVDTIKRVVKKNNKVWKRMKKRPGKEVDPKLVEEAQEDIAELKRQDKKGLIDLYYFDESGFSLTPSVPYAWQNIGSNNRIKLPSSRSEQLNVAGFLSPFKKDLKSWLYEGSTKSKRIINMFDTVSESLTKETWIILDNASFHKSKMVKKKIKDWEKKGLFLYYLPPYSPHLNLIERLWQFMKYQWMPLDAYTSLITLKKSIENMLYTYGDSYKINFA